jgi:hypothetical protein
MEMRQRILNNRPQPVELHLASGVVVIPALGEAEIEADDAGERHLEYLASELRVTILPAAADEEPAPEASEQRTAKKTPSKRSR